MAAANYPHSEDQFLCSICLDVLTFPVTISCGHNFCKTCIDTYWNTNDQYLCPMCKKVFNPRPELHVNTFISEMVAQFRQSAPQEASSSRSEQQEAKPGEVPCDVCTGSRLKALKSCLVCLVSYCETHLEPHLTRSGLKRHQLIDPVENLEGRMCRKHDKPLELFCKTDQTCVCMLCSVLDHKKHKFVPLKEEYEDKKAELGKTEAETQQMIQKRQLKIQEIKHSVDLSDQDADRVIGEGVQVFTGLMDSVQRVQNEFIKTIEEKQRTAQKQAEGFIKELEQEISELKKRSTEVEKVSLSEDHVLLLQSFPSLKAAAPTMNWTRVRVHPPSYERTVVKAVVQLEETLSTEKKKLVESELKRVQVYAVDVTLDPDTANPELNLSDDGKEVSNDGVWKNLPYSPKRFSDGVCVLAKQSFSSGRFYFEVQVEGKTEWDLGVARESINRKGSIQPSPQEGYWTISLENGNEFYALAGPLVRLSLKSRPQKVGVFVDYEEGLVSFYDVDAAALIYSFTGCSFTDKLLPFFNPGLTEGCENSAPLIIGHVRGRRGLGPVRPDVGRVAPLSLNSMLIHKDGGVTGGRNLEKRGSRAAHQEEPVEVARASVPDAPWTPPSGGVPGMPRQEETPRKTQDTLEGLCRPAGLGTPWGPPGGARGSVRGEGSLGVLAQAAAPATRPRISGRQWMMDERMGGSRGLNALHAYRERHSGLNPGPPSMEETVLRHKFKIPPKRLSK